LGTGIKVEESLGSRQGQRTDLQPRPELAEVKPGTRPRDIVAEAIGMKRETYRQAKAVIDSGQKEVIEQMKKRKGNFTKPEAAGTGSREGSKSFRRSLRLRLNSTSS